MENATADLSFRNGRLPDCHVELLVSDPLAWGRHEDQFWHHSGFADLHTCFKSVTEKALKARPLAFSGGQQWQPPYLRQYRFYQLPVKTGSNGKSLQQGHWPQQKPTCMKGYILLLPVTSC